MNLLERDDCLSDLMRCAENCANHNGGVVTIYGEAGIGKTTLVNVLLDQVKANFFVCIGWCESLFTPRPFGPLFDMASDLGPGIIEMLLVDSNRSVIFNRLFQHIKSKSLPVILVFEDVHWADEATLDFIKFIGRRISQVRCLLILTYRDNELDTLHPLRRVLGELPVNTLHRFYLRPFSKETVENLALGANLPGPKLYDLTGGNPFYVFEILANRKLAVSQNVKDSVISYLNKLSVSENQLLSLISVFPQRVEMKLLNKIQPEWGNVLDPLLKKGVLKTDGKHILFNHELTRLAISESIYPMERIKMHQQILAELLNGNKQLDNLSSIVHHAVKARDLNAILQFAPKAAQEASRWGAHSQAASLYKIVLENTDAENTSSHAGLLESYAYECYLTNHLKEAIEACHLALDIWNLHDKARGGNAYRWLSRLYWYDGKTKKAFEHGFKAIQILEDVGPDSGYLASAYSNYGQLWCLSYDLKESSKWSNKAIEMAIKLNDKEIHTRALTNLSLMEIHADHGSCEQGFLNLSKSLKMAQEINKQDQVGRAYAGFYFCYICSLKFEKAKDVLKVSKTYCRDNDLDSYFYYLLALEACFFEKQGDWVLALEKADQVLSVPNQNGITVIVAMTVKTMIKTRTGDPDALDLLETTIRLAFNNSEYQRVIPVACLLLEYEWINNKSFEGHAFFDLAMNLYKNRQSIWLNSELSYWLNKNGLPVFNIKSIVDPYASDIKDDWQTASIHWESLGCEYYRALSLALGGVEERKISLAILGKLGAKASIIRIKQQMRERGIKNIPRGQRASTRNNPAQLTIRQLEILPLLKEGLKNNEIADRLFISPKTVDHHISAILSKLDVGSRSKAVHVATEKGILK